MRPVRLLALTVPVALVLAGCGGGGDDGAKAPPADALAPRAPAADFPEASELDYQRVQATFGKELGLAPGASVLRRGVTRIPFLVLDAGARPVRGERVALYTMNNDGSGVRGPFPAREQPFDIRPAYVSRTSSADLARERQYYVADVRTNGRPVAMFALARKGDDVRATSATTVGAKREIPDPPDVGDKAIRMHTLTGDDVAGNYAKLTTRQPANRDMLQTDFADVLGRKPVVLVFATPQLCQSRVCGPTVDVAEQVKAEYGDRVAWVHQEVYVDNTIKKGLRPQLVKWRLLSEPWIFVIGRDGRISSRLEGAISVPELSAAVRRVAGG